MQARESESGYRNLPFFLDPPSAMASWAASDVAIQLTSIADERRPDVQDGLTPVAVVKTFFGPFDTMIHLFHLRLNQTAHRR
ncbi:hypothetical protein [Novipirellula herctigrandis]|uniref:hypothetical protein n=1 Tax=Novipirellula herctigrandis TaxID=2527986 RepID=UPI003AF3FA08